MPSLPLRRHSSVVIAKKAKTLPPRLFSSSFVCLVVLLLIDCSSFARAQSVPSAAPSPDPCHDELTAIQTCFAGDRSTTPSQCVDCVKTFWQSDASLCTDIDDETCAGLVQCSPQDCATCGSEIHHYIQCLSGCDFECPTTAPSPSAPAPAPTANQCPNERDALNTCVKSPSGSVSECEACVVSFWPSSTSSSQSGGTSATTTSSAAANPGFYPPSECAVIETDTCRGLTNCHDLCGQCEPEFVTYFECETACTLVNTDCAAMGSTIPAGEPGSAPAPPTPITSGGSGGSAADVTPTMAPTLDNPCPDEYQTFNACVGEGSDCEDCVIAYWDPNVTSCDSIDDATCTGLSKCSSCTHCEESFVTYLVCLTKDACSFDCPFAAAGDPVAPTPTPLPADPTTPTAGGTTTSDEQCTEPLGTLEDCLATKVTGAQRDECHSCASAAFDAGKDITSCLDLQDNVCAALTGDCAAPCGECRDLYRDYFDCRATSEISGCRIADCSSSSSGTTAATPLEEQGSTSSAEALAGTRPTIVAAAAMTATVWTLHRLVGW